MTLQLDASCYPGVIPAAGRQGKPKQGEKKIYTEIITVSAAEAMAMARRLAREEGLFAGASTGANVVAALRVAERLGSGATVATPMIDSGIKYLSTEVYRVGSSGLMTPRQCSQSEQDGC